MLSCALGELWEKWKMKSQRCMTFDPRFLKYCKNAKQKEIYETYGICKSRVTETARRLNRDPSNISKTIRRVQENALLELGEIVVAQHKELIYQQPKVLFFDIETSLTIAGVFRFRNINVSHEAVFKYGQMISFAAKWMGEDTVVYEECRGKNNKQLIKKMLALLEEADIVVGHNGRAFDYKWVKAEALKHKLPPIKPPKILDTLSVCRKEFKLHRNTLEYVADFLGCELQKGRHSKFPGIELWVEVEKKNAEAWKELREYNILDTHVLEEIYYRLRPYASTHPNIALFMPDDIKRCPKCYSIELQPINPIMTNTQTYDGYRCKNCGGIARGNRTINTKTKRRSGLRNAV